MNLQEFVHNILKPHFTGFLKANLDYNDNNFEFLNYNILGSSDDEIDINVPDILLKDNDNLIAIVLFKRWESFEETEALTRIYLKSIENENCPTFLFRIKMKFISFNHMVGKKSNWKIFQLLSNYHKLLAKSLLNSK